MGKKIMRQELTYNLCLSYWDKVSGNELLLGYFLLSLKWCSKSSTLISETDQFSTDVSDSTHLAIEFWGDLLWRGFLSTCDLIKQRKGPRALLGGRIRSERWEPEQVEDRQLVAGPHHPWETNRTAVAGSVVASTFFCTCEFVFLLHSLINC